MTNDIKENKKFFSQRAISITTYFGGPLAAGILIRENYKSLEKEKQGINALIIGIVSTILVFVGLFSIPENIIDKIPNALIPLIYTGIIYLIVEKIQGKELKFHKKNNGEFYSGWKAAGIGAISLGIILASIFLVAFIAGDLSKTEPNFDAESYDNGLSTFFENETSSLKVLQSFETENIDYLKNEVNKSIVLWKENKTIIDNISEIENLPIELSVQNEKLKKYCDLRIEHFELISKALNEDTDKYANQIQNVGLKIENIINELQ